MYTHSNYFPVGYSKHYKVNLSELYAVCLFYTDDTDTLPPCVYALYSCTVIPYLITQRQGIKPYNTCACRKSLLFVEFKLPRRGRSQRRRRRRCWWQARVDIFSFAAWFPLAPLSPATRSLSPLCCPVESRQSHCRCCCCRCRADALLLPLTFCSSLTSAAVLRFIILSTHFEVQTSVGDKAHRNVT